jgi:hypothetical protein
MNVEDLFNNNDMKEDKIINNSFNSGELNFQEFTQSIKIDNRVSDYYDDQLGDVLEHRTMNALKDLIYEIFEKSEYYQKYKNPKRVDKNDMLKMYYFFKQEIKKRDKRFSTAEFFIGYAEFFQINYDQLHKELGVSDKEDLLRETTEKYNRHNELKTKRLF